MTDTTLLDDNFTPISGNLTNQQIAEINLEKINLTDHLDNFRMGRHVLIALSVLAIISMFVGMANAGYDVSKEAIIIEGLILCALYAGLALLIARKPLLAMVMGLILFVLYTLLLALIEPASVFSGLIIKIVLLVGFYKGITGYLSAKKSGTKLRNMGVPQEDIELALRKIQNIPRTQRIEDNR